MPLIRQDGGVLVLAAALGCRDSPHKGVQCEWSQRHGVDAAPYPHPKGTARLGLFCGRLGVASTIFVNQKICQLRPVEREVAAGRTRKKNGCCNPCGNCARSEPNALRAIHSTNPSRTRFALKPTTSVKRMTKRQGLTAVVALKQPAHQAILCVRWSFPRSHRRGGIKAIRRLEC